MQPSDIVRVGMARSFQRVNIFPRKSVFENVQVALIATRGLATNPFRSAAGLFRLDAMALLDLVHLAGDAERRAGELAYGRQKQLELAIALAADPKFLLLDEPTAGMSITETVASIRLITDSSKEVATLGAFPLPVEIIPFGWEATRTMVEDLLVAFDVLGQDCVLRRDGDRPVMTDNGNHILDLHLTRIADPTLLALRLNQIPGVVENGLFIGICDTVVIGHGDGRVEVRDQVTGSVTEDHPTLPQVDNIFCRDAP
jgi:hypothetical protein